MKTPYRRPSTFERKYQRLCAWLYDNGWFWLWLACVLVLVTRGER